MLQLPPVSVTLKASDNPQWAAMFGLHAQDFTLLMRLILRHAPELARVVLFGSRARGESKPYSDIDLAVLYKTPSGLKSALEESQLPFTFDLVDLSLEQNTVLSQKISQEGVLLFDAECPSLGARWMAIAMMHQKLYDFKQSLARLEEALSKDPEKDSLYLDAVIQRFEFTYELCWKLQKAYLAYLGIEANNPRSVIRESLKQRLIDEAYAQTWFAMIDQRNLTTHTYHLALAKNVYTAIKTQFVQLLRELQEALEPLIEAIG